MLQTTAPALMNDWIATGCGLSAAVVVVLVWAALVERDPLASRLKNLTLYREQMQSEHMASRSRIASMQRMSMIKQIIAWLKLSQGRNFDQLKLKLERAGKRGRDAVFVFLFSKLALAFVFAAFVAFLSFLRHQTGGHDDGLLAQLLGAVSAGWVLPDVWIKNLTQKRMDTLRKSMPDALDLLVICAEAGLSLDAAFSRVSKEMAAGAPEMAEEVGLTSIELGFLPDRGKALRRLTERVPLPNMTALVNTLQQTEKYGTPLAQALRVLAGEMRDERMMRAEEKAHKLPAILTVPMILFILPPLFVVLIGPAIIRVMTTLSSHH
ncbi:MAG: type II secretion system F family protein [Alphaproteobacteria bacterium]|nr:type II secretion system F family protein [Alphaproteobacteria bacterium]